AGSIADVNITWATSESGASPNMAPSTRGRAPRNRLRRSSDLENPRHHASKGRLRSLAGYHLHACQAWARGHLGGRAQRAKKAPAPCVGEPRSGGCSRTLGGTLRDNLYKL